MSMKTLTQKINQHVQQQLAVNHNKLVTIRPNLTELQPVK